MKNFLIKIITFTAFAFIVSIFLYFLFSNIYFYKVNSLKLDNKITTLFLGDSHTQCAINDSIFNTSVNFSQNSEHYLYTYNVLNLIIKNNPQIKNVVLGCSFHNFGIFYDNYLFDKEKTSDKYPRYFSILDNGDKFFLIKNNFPGVIKSLQKILSNMISPFTEHYLNYRDYPFIGRYYPSIRTNYNDSTINAAVARHFYSDSTETRTADVSLFQLEYLKDISLLCKENKIKLIILNTPLHENYYKKIPQKFISDYYSFFKELHGNDNVTVFDYHDYKLPDNYFGDGDHLNKAGASVFTTEIMEKLKE